MTTTPTIFLYSHDTFGLGHLRRNRKIAAAIRAARPDVRIVLATGSGLSAQFPEIPGMDVVALPPVNKQADGTYRPADGGVDMEKVLRRRSDALNDAVGKYKPDIFIADKEPLGLLGELEETLANLSPSTRKILGVRDVLDERAKLRKEWSDRGLQAKMPGLYDEIWVYGPRWFHEPLIGLDLATEVLELQNFVGFLATEETAMPDAVASALPEALHGYVLVTAGGGEDGSRLMHQALDACQAGAVDHRPLVLLTGPLMASAEKTRLEERVAIYPDVHLAEFRTDTAPLVSGAAGVIAMCGYNTFCEVMQADKPVLFVPRETPREEQLIRATRSANLGASSLLRSSEADDPAVFARMIKALPDGPRASRSKTGFVFDGLDNLCRRIGDFLDGRDRAA